MSRVLPILFNTEMVRAILDGRKTVTRRLIKPQPQGYFEVNEEPLYIYDTDFQQGRIMPTYQPGDILYVRETWHKYKKRVGNGEGCHIAEFYGYKASIANSEDANEPWKPSIHMPKEATRIWLNVNDVRVERLQDMNEVDTAKEGIRTDVQTHRLDDPDFIENFGGIELFKDLWNSTIRKSDLDSYGWDANPWVWAIEFERCEKPED